MVLIWAVQSIGSLWNVPREEETANREWKIYFKPSLVFMQNDALILTLPWRELISARIPLWQIFVKSDFPSSTLGFAMFNALPGKLFSNQLRNACFEWFWFQVLDFILITPCSYKNQDKRGTLTLLRPKLLWDSKETEVNVKWHKACPGRESRKAVNVMKNGGYYFLNTYYIASIAQCKYIVSFG